LGIVNNETEHDSGSQFRAIGDVCWICGLCSGIGAGFSLSFFCFLLLLFCYCFVLICHCPGGVW